MVQAYQEGKFLADPESRGKPRPNPMSDPAAMEGMMGMMKGNMAMMIPQSLIMGWINAFFSGFVISEFLPFPWCCLRGAFVADVLGRTCWEVSPCELWTEITTHALHSDHRAKCRQSSLGKLLIDLGAFNPFETSGLSIRFGAID